QGACWCEYLVKELVIEVVTVGQQHCGWVRHRRVTHDLRDIEQHLQALAGALRMPDNTSAAVASLDSLYSPSNSAIDCMELVILSNPLDQPVALVSEGDEIPHEVEKDRRREHAAHEDFQLRHSCWCQRFAIDCLPRCVVLEFPAQCAQARLGASRNH